MEDKEEAEESKYVKHRCYTDKFQFRKQEATEKMFCAFITIFKQLNNY